MDTFVLLSPRAENPLLDLTLRESINAQMLWPALVLVSCLLAHAIYTDLFCGRKITNSTSLSLFCLALAIVPLVYQHAGMHMLIAGGVIGFIFILYILGAIAEGDVKLYVGLAVLLGQAMIPLLLISWLLIIIYSLPIIFVTHRERKRADSTMKFGQRLGAGPGGPGIALAFPVTLWAAGFSSEQTLGLLAVMGAAVAVFYLNGLLERKLTPPETDDDNQSENDERTANK